MARRIIFSVITLILGFTTPWWVVIPIFILGSYIFAPWFELILIGLLLDLVFGVDRLAFYNFEFIYSTISVISIGLMYFVKKRVINV